MEKPQEAGCLLPQARIPFFVFQGANRTREVMLTLNSQLDSGKHGLGPHGASVPYRIKAKGRLFCSQHDP